MTEDQLKQMQDELDAIMIAASKLRSMIEHVKDPSKTPSPFSGGGPGEEK